MFDVSDVPVVDELTAETTLAAIGLDAVLGSEPRFTNDEKRQATSLQRRLRKDVLTFLASSKPIKTGALHSITWKEADSLLYPSDQDEPHKQAQALLRAVGDPRLAMAVSGVAQRAVHYLQQQFPRHIRTSLAGSEVQPPDPLTWARFRSLWEVACNPEIVLQDLQEGALQRLAERVPIVEMLYPSLYALIRQAVVDGVIAMRAERKTWHPSRAKEQALNALLQTQTSDLAADIQSVYAKQEAPQQGGGGGGPSSRLKLDTSSNTTPAQRTEG